MIFCEGWLHLAGLGMNCFIRSRTEILLDSASYFLTLLLIVDGCDASVHWTRICCLTVIGNCWICSNFIGWERGSVKAVQSIRFEKCTTHFLCCDSLQSRRDFLCEHSHRKKFSRRLEFFRQWKTGERKKVLPRGWTIGKRKDRGGGGAKKIFPPPSSTVWHGGLTWRSQGSNAKWRQ